MRLFNVLVRRLAPGASRMNGQVVRTVLGLIVAATVLGLPGAPALAASEHDAGLQAQGILADYDVTPGQTLTHKIDLSLGAQATALDMLADANGLGQGLDGSVIALAASDDKSPYSARSYIQSVDPPAFHLDPGGHQAVNVTIAIPKDAPRGIRYADVYVHSKPSGSGRIGVIIATHVPVILRIGNPPAAEQGTISDLKVEKVVPGRPIQVDTTIQNTGADHFKATNQVTLRDPSGKEVATQATPLSSFSIVPTFARQFKVSFGLLDKMQGLPAGRYVVESKVLGADGKVVDSKQTSVDLTGPYEPFPGIDPDTVVVTYFNDEVPHEIDAQAKAGVKVDFTGTDKVTGVVVIGRFKGEAPGDPRFGADSTAGGMGQQQTPVKYVGVGVQGFSDGNAHLSVYFTSDEVASGKANELYLAGRIADGWTKLQNLAVFSGAQNAQGDLPVAVLNQNPVIALALDEAPAVTTSPVSNASLLDQLKNTNPLVLAGGVGAVVILGLVVGASRAGRRAPAPRAPEASRLGPSGPSPSRVGAGKPAIRNQLADRGRVSRPRQLPEGRDRENGGDGVS